MKKNVIFTILFFTCLSLWAQNVTINGNKFNVSGKEIWFNGINTPWHLFDDFGRNDFDSTWWASEFELYATNNINLARVWIHGSGEVSPDIDDNGYVSGANDLFWEHMDVLMSLASKNKVYVMPALFSFDITKETYSTHNKWRLFLQSKENIQSYIDNVLTPLVKRYENEPYLLGWEICNEPEWMFENSEHGPQEFSDIQLFHALLAAAIHKNTTKYVTTGSAAPKWNSPIYDSWGDNEGNMFSDEALSTIADDELAYLDFYQYHWYPWQTEWMSSPFTQTTTEYEVDDRPVIVGESEGNDVCDDFICQTVTEMYESAYTNGFDGVCAWKTPQNDGHGTFENISVATNSFYTNHPQLVYPQLESIAIEGISIDSSSITLEVNDNLSLTTTITPTNASDKSISWSSSDLSIATVNNGLVTGIDTGIVIIKAVTNDGSFTDSCTVTVISQTPNPIYDLTINIIGSGNIELNPEGGSYEEGTEVTLIATADTGYTFSAWSGAASGSSSQTTVTMDSDILVTATFAEYSSPCDSPSTISNFPFSIDGTGESCWVTDANISHVNSWNLNILEINGVDYTNSWSDELPEKIDDKYYVYYEGLYEWSHFEASGELKNASINKNENSLEITAYPNPFIYSTEIKISNPDIITSIIVFDSSGMVVEIMSTSNIGYITSIGENLSKGIYFVNIKTSNNDSKTIIINKK